MCELFEVFFFCQTFGLQDGRTIQLADRIREIGGDVFRVGGISFEEDAAIYDVVRVPGQIGLGDTGSIKNGCGTVLILVPFVGALRARMLNLVHQKIDDVPSGRCGGGEPKKMGRRWGV